VRWLWVSAVAILVLALGVFALDRVSLSILGVGPLEFLRPSMADALDGRVSNASRLAAVEAVNAELNSFELAGTTEVGRQVYTWCRAGQNNWKVHDGFRLRCGVAGRSYSAWTGDFEEVRTAARESLSSRCSGPDGQPVKTVPSPQLETPMERYTCAGATSVTLIFASPVGLLDSDSVINQGTNTDSSRYLSGVSSTELRENLANYQWFAIRSVSKVYYQD